MKQTYEYSLDGHTCSALLAPRRDGYYLAFLTTHCKIRNRGCATRVLSDVCADADKTQNDLWLDIAPLGSDIDHTRLEEFYRRFGFVKLRGEWHRRFKYENTNEKEEVAQAYR